MDDAQERHEGLTPIRNIVSDELLALDLQTLVVLLAAKIIADRDGASVSTVEWPGNTLIEFALQKRDRGRLLGRSGNVINAIRTLVRAIQGPNAAKHMYRIDLVPDQTLDGPPKPRR